MFSVSISHIETCQPCYVQDHCNGEHEFLIGVPVDGQTTHADVFSALDRELDGCGIWDKPEPGVVELLDQAIIEEIRAMKAKVPDMRARFDPSLDPSSDLDMQMGETPQAWFRVTWSEQVA